MKKIIIKLLIIFNIVLSNAATTTNECDNVSIINRNRWGGKAAVELDYQLLPVKYVVINHTVTNKCTTRSKCSKIVASIQSYHMDTLRWHDIGYNFLIGNDGNVYEGVGWHKIGAHTRGYNSKSIGIGFIGDFSDELPTDKALTAAKQLLNCGVQLGELDKRYKLLGARQINRSESPGLELYNEIQEWDNWSATI